MGEYQYENEVVEAVQETTERLIEEANFSRRGHADLEEEHRKHTLRVEREINEVYRKADLLDDILASWENVDHNDSTTLQAVATAYDQTVLAEERRKYYGGNYWELAFENVTGIRIPDNYVEAAEFTHVTDSEGSGQYWLWLSPEAGDLLIDNYGAEPQTLRERLREFNDVCSVECYVNGERVFCYDVSWTDDSDEMIENRGGFLEERESGDIHVGAGEYYRRAVE